LDEAACHRATHLLTFFKEVKPMQINIVDVVVGGLLVVSAIILLTHFRKQADSPRNRKLRVLSIISRQTISRLFSTPVMREPSLNKPSSASAKPHP
jgi:hypothetical protein